MQGVLAKCFCQMQASADLEVLFCRNLEHILLAAQQQQLRQLRRLQQVSTNSNIPTTDHPSSLCRSDIKICMSNSTLRLLHSGYSCSATEVWM